MYWAEGDAFGNIFYLILNLSWLRNILNQAISLQIKSYDPSFNLRIVILAILRLVKYYLSFYPQYHIFILLQYHICHSVVDSMYVKGGNVLIAGNYRLIFRRLNKWFNIFNYT